MQILAHIREELQANTRRWLLIGLGVNLLVGLGLAAYILLVILPPFAEGQALSLAVEAAEREAEVAERAAAATPGELEVEIEAMQAVVAQRAGAFIAAAHAAEMAQRLYAYAAETGVQILAIDDRAVLDADETAVYGTSTLRLEATGPMAQLLLFVARIESAAQPGVQFRDLSIADAGGGVHRLAMDLLLHISPYADASRPLPTFPVPDALGSADQLRGELNAALQARDWVRAARLIQALLERAPREPGLLEQLYEVRLHYGYELLESGQEREAAGQFLLALEIKPNGAEALDALQKISRAPLAPGELQPLTVTTPAPPTEEPASPQLVKPENWPTDWPWPPTRP
jgi:hypothetical protein